MALGKVIPPKENFKVFLLAGGAGWAGVGFFSAGRREAGEFFCPNFQLWGGQRDMAILCGILRM